MDGHYSSMVLSAPTILGLRVQSQAHHLTFFNLCYWNCNEKRTKINKKRQGLVHFWKKHILTVMINLNIGNVLSAQYADDICSIHRANILNKILRVNLRTLVFGIVIFSTSSVTLYWNFCLCDRLMVLIRSTYLIVSFTAKNLNLGSGTFCRLPRIPPGMAIWKNNLQLRVAR